MDQEIFRPYSSVFRNPENITPSAVIIFWVFRLLSDGSCVHSVRFRCPTPNQWYNTQSFRIHEGARFHNRPYGFREVAQCANRLIHNESGGLDCFCLTGKGHNPAMTRDQIIQQLRERIVAFATSRGRREVAEDLAQEVLMVLHEKYPQVTELTELVPLSFQILRFKILDLHRKTLRRGEYHQESIDDRPLADPGDDPAVQAEQKERVGQLIDGLQELGERCRELFRLKLQGHTFPGNSTDIR